MEKITKMAKVAFLTICSFDSSRYATLYIFSQAMCRKSQTITNDTDPSFYLIKGSTIAMHCCDESDLIYIQDS